MEVKHIGEGMPVSNLHKGIIRANSGCDAELMITASNTIQVILWDELLLRIRLPSVYSVSKSPR